MKGMNVAQYPATWPNLNPHHFININILSLTKNIYILSQSAKRVQSPWNRLESPSSLDLYCRLTKQKKDIYSRKLSVLCTFLNVSKRVLFLCKQVEISLSNELRSAKSQLRPHYSDFRDLCIPIVVARITIATTTAI